MNPQDPRKKTTCVYSMFKMAGAPVRFFWVCRCVAIPLQLVRPEAFGGRIFVRTFSPCGNLVRIRRLCLEPTFMNTK